MKSKAQKRRVSRDNKIVHLHEQGLRAVDIAKEVGCSVVTVYKVFQKRNIPVNKVTDELREVMVQEYETSDLSYKDIADKYGVSYNSVYTAHQAYKARVGKEHKPNTQGSVLGKKAESNIQGSQLGKGKASLEQITKVYDMVRESGVTVEQLTAYAELSKLLGSSESTPEKTKDVDEFLDVIIE